ncbi:MAG: hypothetical protein IE922_09615 [Sphingomonadales bacterium]|nr:hypothetical protein [Sphingomonadales bacterium]
MAAFLLLPHQVAAGNAPAVLSAEKYDAVIASVTKQLIDPSSAEFTEIAVATSAEAQTVVCGLVNAKNSFGGYVGRTIFVARETAPGTFFALIGQSDIARESAVGICSGLGILPD